eukprot:9872357-Ditylum_brightwellii.AAC.1
MAIADDNRNNVSRCKRYVSLIVVIAELEIKDRNAHCTNGQHNNLDCHSSNDGKLNVDKPPLQPTTDNVCQEHGIMNYVKIL